MEAWNPLKVRTVHRLRAHPYGCWGLLFSVLPLPPSSWPSQGPLPTVPLCSCLPAGHVCLCHQQKKCTRQAKGVPAQEIFVQQFHIWVESYCKSLLHHWLFAGCSYSSPGIFLTTFRQKSKLAAEKSKPAQAPEAIRELLEGTGELSLHVQGTENGAESLLAQ